MQNRSLEIDPAVSGTCNWLLQHETYKSWSAHDHGLLWIKGKPGSGKSTLLRYALDNHKAGDDDLVLSFFFHGRGDELQRSPLGFVRSILHQILGRAPDSLLDLVDTFEKRYDEMGNPGEGWDWHSKELQRFVESSLRTVIEARSVWLFVDALDECGKDNAVYLFRWLKTLVRTLQPTDSHSRIQVCISCRHYPVLDRDCEFVICPEDQNMQDISTYVRAQLSESPELAASCIPDLITDHSYGVFMWARLVVEQVLDLDLEGAPLEIIAEGMVSIPPDLEGLYEDLARDMESPSSKLIQWVCFANRPLSLDELRWATTVDVDSPHRSLKECRMSREYISDNDRMRQRVHTLSRGLAEITESGTVQFIHQSVDDFFTNQKGLSILMNSSPSPATDKALLTNDFTPETAVGMAHFRLARICLRYLAMEEISQSTDTISYEQDDFPFLRYATTLWIRHAQQCYAARDDLLGSCSWLTNDLLETWSRVWDTLEHTYTSGFPPRGTNIFHVVSRYGFLKSLQEILQEGDPANGGINAKDKFLRSPLTWAVMRGREAVVQSLLATGKVEVDAKDNFNRTPLFWAAETGHQGLVKLLVASGAEVNSRKDGGETPLSTAAENGHKAVVEILLATGKAEAGSKDCHNKAPLTLASAKGYSSIVQILLATGEVEPDLKNWIGRTPLSLAAEGGHESSVKLLIASGEVEVDSTDKEGRTPLLWAAKRGSESIVKLLLATGKVNADSEDKSGRTPLSYACENGHEGIVRALLATGRVKVGMKDDRGRTPLSCACGQGHEGIVKLLLATGEVDVDSGAKNGPWPLWTWARQSGHDNIVKLLKEARGRDGEASTSRVNPVHQETVGQDSHATDEVLYGVSRKSSPIPARLGKHSTQGSREAIKVTGESPVERTTQDDKETIYSGTTAMSLA